MLLQRFGAILSNNSGLKKADLEAFMLPAPNNMEAIWAVTLLPAISGKLYTRLSMKISVWMAYFMGFHVAKHPGVNFHQNVTLNNTR